MAYEQVMMVLMMITKTMTATTSRKCVHLLHGMARPQFADEADDLQLYGVSPNIYMEIIFWVNRGRSFSLHAITAMLSDHPCESRRVTR
jgi:hypothetical protein